MALDANNMSGTVDEKRRESADTPVLLDERAPGQSSPKVLKWIFSTLSKVVFTALGVTVALLYLNKPPTLLSSPSSPRRYSTHHFRSHCANIPAITTSEFHLRQTKLSEALSSNHLSAFISEPGPSAQYFANISSSSWYKSERPLLLVVLSQPTETDRESDPLSPPKMLLLTPKFEASRAKQLAIPATAAQKLEFVEWAEDEDPYQVLYDKIFSLDTRNHRNRKIVIDDQTRLFVAQGLSRAGFQFGQEVPEDVARLRERKSDAELNILRCINEVTLLVIRDVRERLYLGMKESDASALMEYALTGAGLAEQGVFAKAQFGDHAALPHGGPTDKTLSKHDMITFDVGGSLRGYWSDVTRTFALPTSQIPSGHLQIWKTVQDAQMAALTMAREGVMAEDVDAAARLVISKSGYGERFTHRLGHGIGLEMHESPYLRGGYKKEIEIGNTFSNEPGIYIEGKVGVRLEDCMFIDKSGQAVLLTAGVGGAARSPWMP